MKPGRPPKPRQPTPRTQRPQLKVRVPSQLRDEVRRYRRAHPNVTQDRLVSSAIANYLHKLPPEEALYHRLNNMADLQDSFVNRLETFGAAWLEFLYLWFALWPDMTPAQTAKARKAATDKLTKYLTSLQRSIETPPPGSLNILDPAQLAAFAQRNRPTPSKVSALTP